MWYNEIPEISLSGWLLEVIALFNDTLRAVMALPVLRLFLVLLLFLSLVSFLAYLVQRGRKGRM